jgi:hypothetical protein
MASRTWVLILRFVFCAVLALLSVLITRTKWVDKIAGIKRRQFDGWFFAIFAVSHFAMFVVVFLILHQQPWADLTGAYMPQAEAAMHGLMPYRDFESAYAPLNPFLDAALLRLHHSPLTILVFQICCEILAVPFWMGFLRRFMKERSVRLAAVLYLLQPLVMWNICIDGKNQGMICLLLSIALFTIGRREILSGVSYSISIVAVKLLPIIFFPALFFGSRKRILWSVSALLPIVLVYGAFQLHGVDVLHPVKLIAPILAPQNLPFFITAATGSTLPPLTMDLLRYIPLVTVVLFTVFIQWTPKGEATRLWEMQLSMLLVFLTVNTFNGKTDTSYFGMFFFVACSLVAVWLERGRKSILFPYLAFTAVSLPVTSFWFGPMRHLEAEAIFPLWTKGDGTALLMMALQIVLLYSYFGLAYAAVRSLLESRRENAVSAEAQVAANA